jgi:hypothetical protein
MGRLLHEHQKMLDSWYKAWEEHEKARVDALQPIQSISDEAERDSTSREGNGVPSV